jgi:hypothetical protein
VSKNSGKRISKSKAAMLSLAFGMAASLGTEAFAQEQLETPSRTELVEVQSDNNTPNIQEDWSVSADPLVPVALIAALGLLYAGACVPGLRRRSPGSATRLLAGAAMTLYLVNPQFVEEEREVLPTEVAVVVDKSASQSLDGREILTEELYQSINERLAGIDGVNIRTIEIGNDTAEDGTILLSSLDKGIADIPRDRLGAVILITDGQIHDDLKDTNKISTRLGEEVPFHVLITGEENEIDRRIEIDEAPKFTYLEDESPVIKFTVQDDGLDNPSNETVSVTLSVDGTAVKTVDVIPGTSVEMSADITRTGSNIVELEVEGLEGEITDKNNRIVTEIEGLRDNLNVLLLTGKPNSNTRLLREFLKSDPDANLVHFSVLKSFEKIDDTPLRDISLIPVPTNEIFGEKIQEFDLIIMDSYSYRGVIPFNYFENIADYVREGGALLVVSGSELQKKYSSLDSTPLSDVLPIKPSGSMNEVPYTPVLSEEGNKHPVTRGLDANDENWGGWFNSVDVDVLNGNVVLETDNGNPLLVLGREGEGRVATLLSDNFWLWARGYEGGGPFTELLDRTAHWLMKDRDLEEEALHLRKEEGKRRRDANCNPADNGRRTSGCYCYISKRR